MGLPSPAFMVIKTHQLFLEGGVIHPLIAFVCSPRLIFCLDRIGRLISIYVVAFPEMVTTTVRQP